MNSNDFEKAFSDFIDRREYDQAENALFAMVQTVRKLKCPVPTECVHGEMSAGHCSPEIFIAVTAVAAFLHPPLVKAIMP